MAEFVSLPNLPLRAGEVIIGEKYFDILENPLKKLGIDAIKVPDNPYIDERLSGHADLSVLHRGGKELLLAPYLKGSKFAESMQKRGFEVSFADIVQQAEYPLDAQLNCCVAGKSQRIVCHFESRAADKSIWKTIQRNETRADYKNFKPVFPCGGR